MKEEDKVWESFNGDYIGNELQGLYNLVFGVPARFRTLQERYKEDYMNGIDYSALPRYVRSMAEAVDCCAKGINKGIYSGTIQESKFYVEQMAYVMGLEKHVDNYHDYLDKVSSYLENVN